MGKIGIITDSNSGMSSKEAENAGIHLLPMPFTIDGEEYFEGVNLSEDDFYSKLESGSDILTSQPSLANTTALWDTLLETYESLVVIPMSSSLSGTCDTAKLLANDYDGRVFVVDNKRISVTLKRSVLRALYLSENGAKPEEIVQTLENEAYNSSIYIMVNTLKYLKRGGRITPAVAALGQLLKIKPVMTIQGGKLDLFGNARTVKHAKNIMTDAILNDVKKRFGDDKKNVYVDVAYTKDLEDAKIFADEIKESFPQNEVTISPLSFSVACHIGAGSLAVALTAKP